MMEREQPGVVVDTLGIAGTRAANMLDWNRDIWADNVRRRDPDLYILAYGTNEATDDNTSMFAYRAELREVLTRYGSAGRTSMPIAPQPQPGPRGGPGYAPAYPPYQTTAPTAPPQSSGVRGPIQEQTLPPPR